MDDIISIFSDIHSMETYILSVKVKYNVEKMQPQTTFLSKSDFFFYN